MSSDKAISRRRLLGTVGGYVGATALGVAVASPQEETPPPPDAIAMLYDTTKCIGCKACVTACTEWNGLTPDTRMSGGIWQMPQGLNTQTKNVIQLYEDDASDAWSFVKRQCMHCVDPACVDGCPFQALRKAEKGVVTWDGSRCIGCRYCQVACPYEVPKFEWDEFNPKIVKCEFCRHKLGPADEGGEPEPGCTTVCPTGAVIFGDREALLAQAHARIDDTPGKYYDDRVYGEVEGGGTQVLYLSHVPFEKVGLPELPRESSAHTSKKIHRFFTSWLVFPIALYGVFLALIKLNWKEHEDDVARVEAKGLKEQL